MSDQQQNSGSSFKSAGGPLNVAKDQGTAIQNNYYGVSEARFEALSEKHAVTHSALRSFFKILGYQRGPLEDLDSKLREIATHYKDLVQRLQHVQSEDRQVVALKEQAGRAIEDGDFLRAEDLLNQAEEHDMVVIRQLQVDIQQRQKALEHRQVSIADTNADNGQLQIVQLQYAKAADYYRKAIKSLPDGYESKRGQYLGQAATALYHIGHYADALQYLKESLVIRQAFGDKAGEGRTLNNIGQIYNIRGDSATALQYLEQSLSVSQKIGDKAGEGATLNNISQIYYARGDHAKVLQCFEQSLAIFQEIGDKAGEGATLNNIGSIYLARGDSTTTLQYLEQSLAIFLSIGDKAGEGSTLNNIGRIYYTRGDHTKALQYLEQSLVISQEIGDKAGEGSALDHIGLIYYARGDDTRALQYLEQSLVISQEIGDKTQEGATLNNIGLFYHARGNNTRALQYFEQSLTISQEIGNKALESQTLNNIGSISPRTTRSPE